MAERGPKLAILIDADNTSPRVADALFEEVAKIGEASLRRIYGDFSESRLRGWADILARHAIVPQQQFAYTTGKNSSDIALVIDNSGSESGTLNDVREAAARLIEHVEGANGRVSLVRVSTEPSVLQPLSHDMTAARAALGDLHVKNGWTALYDGIRVGNETLGGAVLGSAAFILLQSLVSSYTERWMLILGLTFVLFVLFAPGGVVGVLRGRVGIRA